MHNHRKTTGKYSRRGKGWKVWPIWATVLADVLMVGVILLTFAFFHHVLPAMRSGGFVPSCDHQTPPDVPLERYREYVAMLHDYARRAVK